MKKKILIVEDSAIMRGALKRVLVDNNYIVVEASDGNKGLDAALNDTFNMIISDINMPGINGLDLIKKIKELPQYRFVPTVILTTESQKTKIQIAKENGASAYLVKPFTEKVILDTVKKLIH